MRLFMAKKTARKPSKKKKGDDSKPPRKNVTQRRHPARVGPPFGRPAK